MPKQRSHADALAVKLPYRGCSSTVGRTSNRRRHASLVGGEVTALQAAVLNQPSLQTSGKSSYQSSSMKLTGLPSGYHTGKPRRCNSSASATVRARSDLRSEEHTSELQSPCNLVCRLLLEKK